MHKHFSSLRGTILVIVVLGLACMVVTLLSLQHAQRREDRRAWAEATTSVLAGSHQIADGTRDLAAALRGRLNEAPEWLRSSLRAATVVPAGGSLDRPSRGALMTAAATTGGTLVVEWDADALLVGTGDPALLWGIAAALAALLSGLVVVAMNRSVVGPLGQLSRHFAMVADGTYTPVSDPQLVDRVDEIGQLTRTVNVMTESLAEAQEAVGETLLELDAQNDILNAALGNMVQGLLMVGPDGRLTIVNDRFRAMFPDVADRIVVGARYDDAMAAAQMTEWRLDPSHAATTKLADGRILACNRRAFGDGGRVETFEDITERREAEARIAHLALHDGLTGLANRANFRNMLQETLGRREDREVAVLCIDLDHFKSVNDTMGHPFGDALLRETAERLESVVGIEGIAARLGGDEFAVILEGPHARARASGLAAELIECLAKPFSIDGQQAAMSASIGMATAPQDSEDAEDLVKSADLALYRAKTDGRNCFRAYEAEMDTQVQARRLMELDLRNAVADGELELYYQPLVNIESHTISGFEALLRWNSPKRGQVPPSVFIPLAEQTGLITQIGAWVLKQGCLEAVRWPDNLRLAVNLSPIQFKSKTLVLDVIAALGHSGLPAHRLELEITESVMLQETDATLDMLHNLRNLGVRISMDDFGTGYSSLSYLRQFPFDKIKIDQSFVRDLPTKNGSVAIVRAVTGLGASLGMTTTAEGVETMEQLEKLRSEGCIEVQGYLFSPPRPASELPALVARYGGDAEVARPMLKAAS